MQVSTTLRRLWLIDPDSLVAGNAEDGSEPQSLEQIFPSVTREVGNWIAQTPPNERWYDDIWKSQTDFTLLDPPEGSPTDADDSEGPLFSPFRQHVYGVYDHVFWDVYHSLKEAADEEIGEFQPPNTTVMALRASEDESSDICHFFPVDTFVYPIWIAPKTTLKFSVDGHEQTLTPEGHTWRFSMWFREGSIATITPQDDAGERRGRLVAVLALGQCEERLVPRIALEDHTIGPCRMEASDGKPWAKTDGEEGDENTPETWPEADHLARAIFLQAGDAVERCSFDDVLNARVEEGEERPETEMARLTLDNEADDDLVYSPLPGNNSIRILVIEPASAEEDELQTRLQVVSLDDKPTYEAISYTWGDPADSALLHCNNSQVAVPRNLQNALRKLRHASRPRHVWADSVCINQQDIPERGQQVSIMRSIYQNAERVLVWLGLDEHHHAGTAFTAVCDIVRAWRPDGDKLAFASYASRLEPMSNEELAPIRAAVTREAWEALRALFEINYFRRFWIIQELALGSSAVVLWGHHHISWGLIGICAAWMMSSGWDFHHGAPITAAYNAFLIYVLPLAKRSGISPFSKLDLSVVLGTTMGRFDSTDARDRIYALLGMPFAGNDPDANPLVTPDYGQDLRSVYTQAARRILEQDQHLRLLSAVQHGPDLDPSYPSWVPKWHEALPAEPLALRDEQGYYANGGELFIPSVTDSDDPDALHLTGLLCTTVTSTSEPLPPNPNLNLSSQTLTSSITNKTHRRALQTLFAELNAEHRQFRASWSATLEKFTLFGFRDPAVQARHTAATAAAVTAQPGKYGMRAGVEMLTGERAQTDHLGEFLLYWRERASWRQQHASSTKKTKEAEEEEEAAVGGGIWKALGEEGTSVYVRERALCAVNALAGRRVMVLADGKVGLGPAAAREGDAVVVLFGGVVPFVLRECEGPGGGKRWWRLVGECFVPGLMQGEAVEEAGLLAEGTFRRAGDGSLTLTPSRGDELDPRMGRKVGEHGVCAFEIR